MKIAMIGLGKMGSNMARRLIQSGQEVVGYDHAPQVAQGLAKEVKITPAGSLDEVVKLLTPPRIVWVMVPSGQPTDETIQTLSGLLQKNDIIIDGGNSYYKDSLRHADFLSKKGIDFVDVGVSGGVWGLENGYSLMVGGKKEVVDYLTPIFAALAPGADQGWGRVGPSGAGHYVKMVHNGIEYGLMEAYAEGFELMRSHPGFDLDLEQIAQIWRFGTVIRSWLLDLIASALKDDPNLTQLKGWVADSGEGRWTVMDAIENAVPLPAIALALFQRFESRQDDRYADKLLAAMRNEFGGHAVKTESNS